MNFQLSFMVASFRSSKSLLHKGRQLLGTGSDSEGVKVWTPSPDLQRVKMKRQRAYMTWGFFSSPRGEAANWVWKFDATNLCKNKNKKDTFQKESTMYVSSYLDLRSWKGLLHYVGSGLVSLWTKHCSWVLFTDGKTMRVLVRDEVS